jgi:hypothetical protein
MFFSRPEIRDRLNRLQILLLGRSLGQNLLEALLPLKPRLLARADPSALPEISLAGWWVVLALPRLPEP